MKGKWLKLWETPVKDTPALESTEFDRRITEYKKERGLAETFRLTTFCQVQRVYFVTVYERYRKDELFEPVRIERFHSDVPAPAAPVVSYSVPASELGNWDCLCGRTGRVFCSCGRTSCRDVNAADLDWSCNPGCGFSGQLTPTRSIKGSKGSRSQALQSGASFPLLPGGS